MTENNMQDQMQVMNQKLDLVLSEVNTQRLNREEKNDLFDDLSIIGKDLFKSTVAELDAANVEFDADSAIRLAMKLIKNIDNFNDMIDMFESGVDLMQDLAPIVQQAGIDTVHQLHEFEQKGYFEFIREFAKVIDKVLLNYTAQDLRDLTDSIIPMMDMVKNLTTPDMIANINKAINAYQTTEIKEVPKYSLWQLFKQLRSPEMRQKMGFMLTVANKL